MLSHGHLISNKLLGAFYVRTRMSGRAHHMFNAQMPAVYLPRFSDRAVRTTGGGC